MVTKISHVTSYDVVKIKDAYFQLQCMYNNKTNKSNFVRIAVSNTIYHLNVISSRTWPFLFNVLYTRSALHVKPWAYERVFTLF